MSGTQTLTAKQHWNTHRKKQQQEPASLQNIKQIILQPAKENKLSNCKIEVVGNGAGKDQLEITDYEFCNIENFS